MKQFINRLFSIILLTIGQYALVNAQSTTAIPYQGVARTAAGNIVANQSISLRFSILEGSASGTLVYQETISTTTNSLGLFTAKIGSTPGPFNVLDWEKIAGSGAFIKTELDISGGSAFVDMGTTQLLSVPFALYAAKSGGGSVNYKGTWDVQANDPDLVSSVGHMGDYYVVSVGGTRSLGGISDWNVGDWAIYNGTIWQKVDNTDAVATAGDVPFTSTSDIVSTNVQDAIEELHDDVDTKLAGKQPLLGFTPVPDTRTVNGHALTANVTVTKSDVGLGNVPNLDFTDPSSITQDATHRFVTDTEKTTWNAKVNRSGDTMTGDLILNANPTVEMGAATKKYVDDAVGPVQSSVSSKVNRSGDTMTGDLILNADPTVALGATTKQYVDAIQTSVSAKVNRSGDTMTGDLVLNADPTIALGAATKQYVDAGDALKLNLTGGTMTGDLVLHADPSSAMNPATKKYVDDADALKADKVTPATSGNFAVLNATGNLVDSDKSPSDYLDKGNTVLFTPANDYNPATKKYVDDQFTSTIDSYIHRLDDGVSIYLPPGGTKKRFGIGDTAPVSPLGIMAEGTDQRALSIKPNILSPGSTYTFSLSAAPGSPGFNLQQENSSLGSVSRLFIQESDGFVGLGTTTPNQKLHIQESTSSDITGMKIQNTASTVNNGWVMGHLQDTDVRDGAFGIYEDNAGGKIERLTVLPGGKIGINELIPDTKLHVSRPLADPATALSLIEGTGIMVLGPMTNNIVADYRGIQARTGSYVGSTLEMVASELNIQRLGGDILIHGDASIAPSSKVMITADGKVGVGKEPIEKIDINGAIKIGESIGSSDGTIRYTGTDFEGRKNGVWKSLTTQAVTDGFAEVGAGMIAYNAAHPKVGIGTTTVLAALHVEENSAVTTGTIASLIRNASSTSSSSADDNRIGLQVESTTTWGGNAAAKNIGIYVKEVSGQSSAESNIAAVLNGNVVVGGITSSQAIGNNGKNVLAIQTGVVPAAIGLTGTAGIQIYSDDISTGAGSPPTSIFHLMNGDGTVIKLFRGDALPTVNTSTISSTTYGPDVEAVINNMRDRINALEAKLQAFGLIL